MGHRYTVCVATLLLKTEPSECSYDDIVRSKKVVWSGVRSPAALLVMRGASRGDEALIYHTGSEKRIVGLGALASGPYEDPEGSDARLVVFDVKAVRRARTPVELSRVKGDKRFAGFALVKQSRLSVMVVPAELDAVLREWAGL